MRTTPMLYFILVASSDSFLGSLDASTLATEFARLNLDNTFTIIHDRRIDIDIIFSAAQSFYSPINSAQLTTLTQEKKSLTSNLNLLEKQYEQIIESENPDKNSIHSIVALMLKIEIVVSYFKHTILKKIKENIKSTITRAETFEIIRDNILSQISLEGAEEQASLKDLYETIIQQNNLLKQFLETDHLSCEALTEMKTLKKSLEEHLEAWNNIAYPILKDLNKSPSNLLPTKISENIKKAILDDLSEKISFLIYVMVFNIIALEKEYTAEISEIKTRIDELSQTVKAIHITRVEEVHVLYSLMKEIETEITQTLQNMKLIAY